jgi:hypothetical protein
MNDPNQRQRLTHIEHREEARRLRMLAAGKADPDTARGLLAAAEAHDYAASLAESLDAIEASFLPSDQNRSGSLH